MIGVFNILKPPAMTSSNVVSAVRRITGIKKTGHMGTLDPGAAGVLPVCVGSATRLFDYLAAQNKCYLAELCFGVETDTLDCNGEIVKTNGIKTTAQELQSILPDFTGDIIQTPPIYSAIKQNGRKLYQLARKGEDTEIPQRRVTISDISLLKAGDNRFLLEVSCGKGTYIRSLARDIGYALGTCAVVSFLLRVKSGCFGIESAVTLDELELSMERGEISRYLMSCESVLAGYDEIPVTRRQMTELLNGVSISFSDIEDGVYRVKHENMFLGLAKNAESRLKMSVRLMDEL